MPSTAIVVGAGIAGLATAIALRQANFQVTILEKRSSITEVGFAIDIPPNATRILKNSFGMDLKKLRGCQQFSVDSFKADVEPMVRLASENRYIGDDAPFLSVHRVDYHDSLKDTALGENGPGRPATLRCSCRVTSYDAASGTVTLETGESLSADIVVAADGNTSKAHKWVVGRECPARPTGLNNLRFIVPSSAMMHDPGMAKLVEAVKDKMCVYGDDNGNWVAHYACRDHTLQNFGLYHDGQSGEEVEVGQMKDIAQQRLKHVSPTFAAIADFVEEDGTYLWQIVDRDPLDRLLSGKLILVGDAAHPMKPQMGQGAAMAVEDAAVLGALMEGLESPDSIPERLKLWEELRRPRASAIQIMSRTLPSSKGFRSPEDEAKAKEFFPPGELPSTRPEMTSWAFRYDAVSEARNALEQKFGRIGETNGL